ncbi:monofunctional biosynthetic peptidoglycan transglycosylase [Geodermatophilus pulveris]|uniref:Monofunctional biosynthetic peptidoglycan transglycosylase n=1 Tax=Geodermatophilus pulveris TaxID=1564159 RepID=A0A239HB89_9ACTN|nr:transglycosylase domain-containing protein [Geodermatophilus pulveris]SNS78669.1 monofunctional biosynthetic peptidoglycan transglycosylase [Geodermatophilus pulveris]
MPHVPPDRWPAARSRRSRGRTSSDRYDDGRPAQDDGPVLSRPVQEPWHDGAHGYGAPPGEQRWNRFRRPGAGRSDRDERRPEADRPSRSRRTLGRRVARVLAVGLVAQALVMVSLRWVDPPTTAFMAANPAGAIQQSVPVEHVSRNFLAAVIAHEDAELPYRAGAVSWEAMWDRAQAHLAGREDPSGSTIPQQVAKNLFLNQEMSAWRKALEAGLAAELALVVDDRRMLELYVNHAQFGPALYGVCAASWYYFDTPPQELPVDQAVQLVGLLPSPGHVQRAPGGGLDFDVADGKGWLSRSHVVNAQNRVPRHIERLGFQPVEDAGITGLASEQPASGDDCSTRPDAVTELIAAEGTA